jgi:hypothetical protein
MEAVTEAEAEAEAGETSAVKDATTHFPALFFIYSFRDKYLFS